MKLKKIIGVIGGGTCSDDIAAMAEEVGAGIAKREAVLICGGLSGVMEAACRGAKSENGLTVGVLPGLQRSDANPFVDLPIVTGMHDARNIIIVRTAHAVIAVDGSHGTLSEISFCLKFGVPVVGLKTWDVDSGIVRAESAQEAVEYAFDLVE